MGTGRNVVENAAQRVDDGHTEDGTRDRALVGIGLLMAERNDLLRESLELQRQALEEQKTSREAYDARVAAVFADGGAKLGELTEGMMTIEQAQGLMAAADATSPHDRAHAALRAVVEQIAPSLTEAEGEDVVRFVERMLVELEAHDAEKPRTWLDLPLDDLVTGATRQGGRALTLARNAANRVEIPIDSLERHAAHAANYLAMIAGNARRAG